MVIIIPGFGHLIFGLAVVAGLLYITRNKMNHKVLFIFFVNNYLGPDVAHIFWNEGHTLGGFIFFAIPLSLFYSYLSRFSLHKTTHFVDFVDDGKREINWKNAFYATVAGGIMHRFIDFLFHGGHYIGLIPYSNWDLSLNDLNSWHTEATSSLTPWIMLNVAFIVIIITGSIATIRNGFKHTITFLGVIAGLYLAAAAATHLEVLSGENELSVFVVAGLFFLAPLLLIGHADRETQAHPIIAPARPRLSRKVIVPLLILMFTTVIGFFFFVAFSAVFLTSWTRAVLVDIIGDDYFSGAGVLEGIGAALLVVTAIGLAGCIGAFFHAKWGRAIIMVVSTLTWYFVIPFGVALVLSEKDVKAWFEMKGKEKSPKPE
ncbi:MAG: hypothetical protein Q6373_023720 [Candidatus Sigynarchaeota archaeon]